MKKVLALAFSVAVMYACNNSGTSGETSTDSTSAVSNESGTAPTETVTQTYTAADGDISWKENKLYVYKNGEWVLAEKDITLDDGTVISINGEVKNKDGKVIQLKEGEKVSKAGQFFDNAGNAVSNAWDKTKEGVSNAAEKTKEGISNAASDVKEGAQKAGEKIEKGANKAVDGVKEGAKKAGEKAKDIKKDIKEKL